MEAMVGIVVGLLVSLIAIALFSRSKNRRLRSVADIVTGSSSQEIVDELIADALKELENDAPHFAKSVVENPKTPVESQPAEMKTDQAERLQDAEDDETAQKIAKEYSRDDDVADILVMLARWKPRRREAGVDLTEEDYEESFERRLKRGGITENEIERQVEAKWSADKRHGGGSRRAVPDMAIKDRVLVELKGNLTASSEADRALGQMLRYLLAWKQRGPSVLAVCGEVSPELRFLIRTHITIWRKTLRLPVTVYFRKADEIRDSMADMPED
ncbi:MAG: hypothetical protein R6V85_11780 [Polyangia bacterium]